MPDASSQRASPRLPPSQHGGAATTSDALLDLAEHRLWSHVDTLVDGADHSSLIVHRLHLYAAARLRSRGLAVPPDIVELERLSATKRLAAPALLQRVRDAYDGRAVLLKGADVATRYPRPDLRPWVDLDLLVPDAERVHGDLLRAGFRTLPVQTKEEHHHLPGLLWPGLPMILEVHERPSWVEWLPAPSAEELLSVADEECALGAGVLSLPRAHHALLLTAHAWRAAPLAHLGNVVDVALMQLGVTSEVGRLAKTWHVDRLWARTSALCESLLSGGPAINGTRLTRHFHPLRDRSVIEAKEFQWLAPFYDLPPGRAWRAAARAMVTDLRPEAETGETWSHKLARTASALRDVRRARSARDEELERKELAREHGDRS